MAFVIGTLVTLGVTLIVAMTMESTFVAELFSSSQTLGSDVVGSGAVVPCGDRPSPALRTVRAACHRTRLALYALLE